MIFWTNVLRTVYCWRVQSENLGNIGLLQPLSWISISNADEIFLDEYRDCTHGRCVEGPSVFHEEFP